MQKVQYEPASTIINVYIKTKKRPFSLGNEAGVGGNAEGREFSMSGGKSWEDGS